MAVLCSGDLAVEAFPENAFNPSWSPYLPQLKPAFAGIATAWEAGFEGECLLSLLRKLDAKWVDITGEHALIIGDAEQALARPEEEWLDHTMTKARLNPTPPAPHNPAL